MAAKLKIWVCLLLSIILCGSRGQVIKPGLKARVTQAGLDYARDVALEFLMAELLKLEIPDVSEKAGPADLYINNIQVLSFDRPVSSIQPEPDIGLRWRASDLNPRIQAEYTAKINLGPIKITKTGTITVTGRGMTLDAQFFIGREVDGRPSVAVTDCSSGGDVVLSFRGGLSDILNLVSTFFKKNIRSLIRAQICFQAKKEINEKAAWALSRFPVTQVIFDGFLLDYQLTQFPRFSPEYLEAYIKGEIRHSSDTQHPGFQPPPIPSHDDHVNKMVYVYVTNYLLNSGLQSAYNVGKLRLSIGDSETESPVPIPEEVLDYFRTTCPNSACLGTIFPQIAVAYPNAAVEMDAFATKAPWLDIDNGALALDAWLQADLFALDDNGRHLLFSVYSNVSSELVVRLHGNRLMFNVTEINPEIEVSGGMVEDGMGFFFEAIARLAVQQALRPKLAEIGGEGIVLPDLEDVTFVNPEVLGTESTAGVLVVATDIRYERQSP